MTVIIDRDNDCPEKVQNSNNCRMYERLTNKIICMCQHGFGCRLSHSMKHGSFLTRTHCLHVAASIIKNNTNNKL